MKNIRIHSSNKGNDADVPIEAQNYPSNSAVYIRNLCKKYGSGPPVLENLSMNVRKGTIYGLLGSSGCGKTTILSCVVGLKTWDSGEILVFGKKPNGAPGRRVGFMPQDLALYEQLTIHEMIQFYGRIYNMSNGEVAEKWVFLTRLLQLPAEFKLIGELSGGQKRRTSLCLSLMQAPDLIVLDEPTVGLDPLLRRSIWNHLYKIVSTLNTTIIITTHYIEEARLANMIGIVRKGKILVEDTPTNLLNTFKCDLLEEVVLQLCRKDESGLKSLLQNSSSMPEEGNRVTFTSKWKDQASSDIVANYELVDGIFRNAVGFDVDLNENLRRKEENVANGSLLLKLRFHPLYESFQRIRGLTTVILLTLLRHPLFISVILLLPTIQGSITVATIGAKPRALGFGVVNNELLDWTTECDMPRHLGNSCDFSALSCKLLNEMKKDDLFTLIPLTSEDDAMELVHRGQTWGYISFDSNYSQHFVDAMGAKFYAFNESIEGSRIRAHLDYSQYVASFFMVKKLLAAYTEYVFQLAESCQLGGKGAMMPMNFREPVYGHNGDDYTEYLMPGVLMVCLLCVLGLLTSVIFITDRKQGTLSRATVAGLRTIDVMISHMVVQCLVVIVQIIVLSFILHIGFGFVVKGSIWLYLLICVIQGLCGAALGILLGNLCADEVEAMIVGIFICPILLLFGGVFWPVEGLPMVWKYIGHILPTTLPIVSLRSVIVRGVGLTHPMVWPGICILVGWTLFICICDIITFKSYTK